MHPILARIGPFFLYSYTVVIGLGIAAALLPPLSRLSAHPTRRLAWLDGFLIGLMAGILLGRVVFVAANWPYYQENPDEMIALGQGGLSYHGALLAGLGGFMVWQWWRGWAIAPQLDLLAPSLVLLSGFGWWACYLEGCAFGQMTVLGWLAADLPDSYGVEAVRYQTQLLGLAWSGLTWVVWWWCRGRKLSPGLLFWLTLGLLSCGRVLVNTLRDDAMPLWHTVRLDTLADGLLVLLALLAGVASLKSASPRFPGN
ncbi:MAG: prolipoprotein diacylglyceryl transferase family protein [Candidatus Promineifilaceae bacterium]